MKRGIAFFTAIVMAAATFAGCGSSQGTKEQTTKESTGTGTEQSKEQVKSEGGKKVFGATYMTMNNPFFVALNDGIKSVVEENGDKLITLDPALDQEKQISQIEDLITQGVDAIFLNPVDWKGIKPALDACKEAGIPVFNVDAPVYDEELVTSIIASDNYDAGVQCAKDMMKKLKSAKITVLEHPTAKSAIDRTQSFIDTIEGKSEYEIVAKQSSEGQLEQAMPVMENIIQAQPEINVVMALNDPTALGALAALQAAGRDKDVLLYGVDGSPDAKKMVKDGVLTATAAQSPIGIGTTAAQTAYAFLEGKTVEKNISVPVVLITKDNVDEYGTDGWQ
ncbi:sugar ABC transporter substrate-binding protein [Anaerosacchariphilus polymeriproducens]|uniref:Sugar ABC transporter substrate-binding protein n=2 Tax=Anaerosacchariphilus polymeriproducens TaxID=1812858 RepID=A0A371AS43_9FIRM|nr:sugar ABC transporter substrate-binding protein [Anaerosacchariphilus polymeriproducens]